LAFYLVTSHHANMLGLYYLPVNYITNDTGMDLEGATKGLASLSEAGFCQYDPLSEWVFVVEMARFQILNNCEPLKPKDKRVEGIAKEYNNMPTNPFLYDFYQKYMGVFHLKTPRGRSPLQGPSEPLPSQEQEQEQKQEQKQDKKKHAETVQTFTEIQIRQCLVEKTDFIKENWPGVNLIIETEEIVAKYKNQTLGADPWVLISRWFKKVPKDVSPAENKDYSCGFPDRSKDW
jgi:RNA polymerase subunit RPABC4/transcription elongation factor Spt4